MLKVTNRLNSLSVSNIDRSIQYDLLFENSLAPSAVLSPVMDMKGRLVDVLVVEANDAFCQAAGLPCEKLRGRLARQFAPVLDKKLDFLQDFLLDLSQALETGQPRSREITLAHLKRRYRYLVFPLSGGLAGITSMEITGQDEKAREAAQARIQHKIIEMREAERQQTANYLHEGLLQALIGVRYAIEEGLGIEQKENRLAKLAAVQATLQREIQSLRDYCNELRPPTLAQFGLEKTIRAYVDTYQKKHARPTITLVLDPDRQMLPDTHRLALFRVFQELFNRIAGAPQAQNVQVQLMLREGEAVLEIHYDGIWPGQALDWAALAQQGQISLASALGWVEGLSGSTEILPYEEQPNRVRIRIPFG